MDKYEEIRTIGKGSFGKAILIRRKSDNELLVLKQINVLEMSPKEREDAMNEVDLLSCLNHENIIAYHDSFIVDGCLHIIMEYANAGDIHLEIKKRILKKKPFKEFEIVSWFIQICYAIQYISTKNILHRDLKTQNIFLTIIDNKYLIKLGDFGIAKILNSDTSFARTVIGTPYYLSPEICEDRPYDHKSDVWSLGCVLYELATLKHAFNANSLPALIMKILKGTYPPVPSYYSNELRSLISTMLQTDPKKRPSITEILAMPFLKPYIGKDLKPFSVDDPDIIETSSKNLQNNIPMSMMIQKSISATTPTTTSSKLQAKSPAKSLSQGTIVTTPVVSSKKPTSSITNPTTPVKSILKKPDLPKPSTPIPTTTTAKTTPTATTKTTSNTTSTNKVGGTSSQTVKPTPPSTKSASISKSASKIPPQSPLTTKPKVPVTTSSSILKSRTSPTISKPATTTTTTTSSKPTTPTTTTPPSSSTRRPSVLAPVKNKSVTSSRVGNLNNAKVIRPTITNNISTTTGSTITVKAKTSPPTTPTIISPNIISTPAISIPNTTPRSVTPTNLSSRSPSPSNLYRPPTPSIKSVPTTTTTPTITNNSNGVSTLTNNNNSNNNSGFEKRLSISTTSLPSTSSRSSVTRPLSSISNRPPVTPTSTPVPYIPPVSTTVSTVTLPSLKKQTSSSTLVERKVILKEKNQDIINSIIDKSNINGKSNDQQPQQQSDINNISKIDYLSDNIKNIKSINNNTLTNQIGITDSISSSNSINGNNDSNTTVDCGVNLEIENNKVEIVNNEDDKKNNNNNNNNNSNDEIDNGIQQNNENNSKFQRGLSTKINALKHFCNSIFGEESFKNIYSFLKCEYSKDEDDTESIILENVEDERYEKLKELLGEKHYYLKYIQQLLYLETKESS